MDPRLCLIQILAIAVSSQASSLVKIRIDKFSSRNSLVQYDTKYRNLLASQADPEPEILARVANNFLTFCQLSQDQCFLSTETLDFSAANLRSFPSSLTNIWFETLHTLNLSSNQINNFNDDFRQFKSRLSLTCLDLTANRLNRIASGTFKQLKSLQSLRLANNRIAHIDSFAFTDALSGLVDLDLSHNYITDTSMEFLIFASLSKLKTLNLGYNQLSTFSDQMILNLYSLQRLDLSNNNLKALDLFSLGRSNTLLTSLDVSFNRNLRFSTSELDQVQFLSYEADTKPADKSSNRIEVLNLSGIDFSGSYVNQFLARLFQSHQQLRHINMSHAKINKNLNAYHWPLHIQTLDLSFNALTDFECPTRLLHAIHLNNNQLNNSTALIDSCVAAKHLELDLRNNLFTRIDNLHSSDPFDQSIKERVSLRLSGNPLKCDCDASSWWSRVSASGSPSLFTYKKDSHLGLLHIVDYEALSCRSVSVSQRSTLTQAVSFSPIRAEMIAPRLACPYEYSCAVDKCKCCGFRECDCAFHCPARCACVRDFKSTFDVVNCTGIGLETVPGYLPTSTTFLQLSHNSLRRIRPYEFFGRFNLDIVDLSSNEISFIEENTFNGLGRLRTLRLSENRLQILLGNEFRELAGLEVLLLNKNRLQFISNVTFELLVNLRYLNLMENELRHVMEQDGFFKRNLLLRDLFVDKAAAGGAETSEIGLKKKNPNRNSQNWTHKNRFKIYRAKFSEVTKSPYAISLKRADDEKSSVIILNYSTIAWSTLAFVGTMCIFSVLLSVLVAKLVRNKKEQSRLVNSPVRLIKHEKALYATTASLPASNRKRKKKSCFKSEVWKSLKKKFRSFVGTFQSEKLQNKQADSCKQFKMQEAAALNPSKCQSNLYSLYF